MQKNKLLDQAIEEEVRNTKRLYFNCFGDEDYILEEGLEKRRENKDE